tara:strand:+ start:797 stop:1777 length:981 start_codon:yes stop_codon:yes gene_type:complete
MTSIIRGSDDFDSADKSFAPTTVTGTTPSLDVGTYNFFDNGTLSADTTVSFASVPTEADWRYSFIVSLVSGAWDVSTSTLLQKFSVTNQEASPGDLFFKPDGLKMYMIGSATGDNVYEYNLSTAWDVTTASYLQAFSVATQESLPSGLFFKPDGTKMYVTGTSGDDVNEYNLSTAWNVTTASYLQTFSVAAQEAWPNAVFFKPDGTKMYIVGLGSPVGDNVYEYNLSTAWNVTTASYSQAFSVYADDTSPTGVFFKPDGLKMYIVGYGFDNIYQYSLGIPSVVTLPASVVGIFTAFKSTTIGYRVTYEFFTLDGGTTATLIGEQIV